MICNESTSIGSVAPQGPRWTTLVLLGKGNALCDLGDRGQYDAGNLLAVLIDAAKAEPGHFLQIGVQRVAILADEVAKEPVPQAVARSIDITPRPTSAKDVATMLYEHVIQPADLPPAALVQLAGILREGADDPEGVVQVMVELADRLQGAVEAEAPPAPTGSADAGALALGALLGIDRRLGRRATAEEVRHLARETTTLFEKLADERETAERAAAAQEGSP